MDNITLQINLSPGDVNYAALTVPALVSKHTDIKKRLLIVDCCRPQKTKLVDPDVMFPADKFKLRVEKIIDISKQLLDTGIMTDVHYMMPGDPLIDQLSDKYLRGVYNSTHSAGGTANMSYWAGIELPDTRYVLHYDGDMLLYQKNGYSWTREAIKYLKENKDAVIATPRTCPPVNDPGFDLPSKHEGRPITSFEHFWLNDWFSTRCFLLDKQRFENYLPLVRSKIMVELLLRKYGRRAFPIDPEILMFRSIAPRDGKRLILKSSDAWLMHPSDKSSDFLATLPMIIDKINSAEVPDRQRGHEDIRMEIWLELLKKEPA